MARPRAVAHTDPFCPVLDAIAVLQGKWTMQIVHALMEGPMGFNELARAIGGCNPSTLAQRLDTLVRLDLLDRRVESSSPPRTLYSLTAAGAALQPVHREHPCERSRLRADLGSGPTETTCHMPASLAGAMECRQPS